MDSSLNEPEVIALDHKEEKILNTIRINKLFIAPEKLTEEGLIKQDLYYRNIETIEENK